jgi:hypothetical protein
MNEDMEVAVTVTPEDMEFRALARAAGLPDIVISMYGTALRRLVAIERKALVALVYEMDGPDGIVPTDDLLAAIRARSKE